MVALKKKKKKKNCRIISFEVDTKLCDKIDREAKKHDRKRSGQIRRILSKYYTGEFT